VLPLLKPLGEDRYEDTTFDLALAPATPFQNVEFWRAGKQQRIRYQGSTDEVLTARVGSADRLLNWDNLRGRAQGRVEAGDIGPAYLKLALDLDHLLPADHDEQHARSACHFLSARRATSKQAGDVRPGLRVLSIDLGVRSFATCSVVELKDTRPENGLAFTLDDLGHWAVQERSFTLELLGEARAGRGSAMPLLFE
jgi:hypothetical protein